MSGLLEIKNISKSFGVVKALKDVSFDIKIGEVHALLGENGAGKSTLIKIIMGEQKPDSGNIILDGVPFSEFSIAHSDSCGIAMVHQELAIFGNMTVAENIFPKNNFRTKLGFIDHKEMNRRAKESIDRFGIDIDPEQFLDSLTLAQQQIVEILRAISLNYRVILLDEPTSGLNNAETIRLMEIIRQLKEDGLTIIYISHRIPEILDICDRVTVLRDGRYEDTLANDENLTGEMLINRMVGRQFSSSLYQFKNYKYKPEEHETIFEIKNLKKEGLFNDLGFKVGSGEVLGIYGLEGSGVYELSRMLYGLQSADSCEMYYRNDRIDKINPVKLIDKKIVYLNNNRKIAGLLLNMSAVNNVGMPVLDEYANNMGILDDRRLEGLTQGFIDQFGIVIASLDTPPSRLSGGNQQKIMLAACLSVNPELMIINDPTRGIDVGAKEEIHNFMLNSVENGTSIILFSSELPELLRLSDRLLVMNKKEFSGELIASQISEESAMKLATMDVKRGVM